MKARHSAYFSAGTWLAQKRYRIERLLSEGSFGQVYLAADQRVKSLDNRGRRCVVKRLKISEALDASRATQLKRDFAREAKLLVTLNDPSHTSIPEIYEYLPRYHCLVMKYIEGNTLWDVLRVRLAALSPDDLHMYGLGLREDAALRYIRSVCDALVYMHNRPVSILHRDLNPANMIVDARGNVWLIDFGISRVLEAVTYDGTRFTTTGGKGTEGFIAPEQWRGKPEPASDMFSLAATLFTLLTSESPPSLGELLRASRDQTPLLQVCAQNRSVRNETELLIRRGMAIDPCERPTALEFLAEVDRLLQPVFPLPAVNMFEIPAVPERFIGRDPELAHCEKLLAEHGVVALVGMAGIGKSTLAYALSRRSTEPAWVFRFSFGSIAGDDELIWACAEFLGRHGHMNLWTQLHSVAARVGGLPPLTQLIGDVIELLWMRPYTLLLDDLHLAPQSKFVNALIQRFGNADEPHRLRLILVSSQVPAFLASTFVVQLEGLPLDAACTLINRSGRHFDNELIVTLCARTEGNPQLLTLADQALGNSANPTQLVNQLLHAHEAADLNRYLRLTVFDSLTAEERELMAAIAIEPEATTSDAVSAILGRKVWRSTLSALWERQLLIPTNAAGLTYRQHSTVQEFYHSQLEPAERRVMHRRASVYYSSLGDEPFKAVWHSLRGSDMSSAVELLSRHQAAIVNRGQAGAALMLAHELSLDQLTLAQRLSALQCRGAFGLVVRAVAAARSAFESALEILEQLPDTPETRLQVAETCLGLGELLEYEEPEAAVTLIRHGLATVEPASLMHGRLLVGLGTALMSINPNMEAEQAMREALVYLPSPLEEWRGRALVGLSRLAGEAGHYNEAARLAREALVIHQQTGNLNGAIGARQNLALTLDLLGSDWEGAALTYEQALEMAVQLGSIERQTEIMLNLGILRTNQGQDDVAERLLTGSAKLARRHHMHVSRVHVLSSLADLYLRSGHWQAAEPPLSEALKLALERQVRHQLPEIVRGLALLHLYRGDHKSALHHAMEAIDYARQQKAAREVALGRRVRAEVRIAMGNLGAAIKDATQSLTALEDERYEHARSLQVLARALTDRNPERARDLLGEARTAFRQLGARRELEQTVGLLVSLSTRNPGGTPKEYRNERSAGGNASAS